MGDGGIRRGGYLHIIYLEQNDSRQYNPGTTHGTTHPLSLLESVSVSCVMCLTVDVIVHFTAH